MPAGHSIKKISHHISALHQYCDVRLAWGNNHTQRRYEEKWMPRPNYGKKFRHSNRFKSLQFVIF